MLGEYCEPPSFYPHPPSNTEGAQSASRLLCDGSTEVALEASSPFVLSLTALTPVAPDAPAPLGYRLIVAPSLMGTWTSRKQQKSKFQQFFHLNKTLPNFFR